MFMEEPPKRIALIVSAQSGNELKAGHSDVSNVYSLLTDPQFGGCTNTNPPIHGCASRNTFLDNLLEVLEDWNLNNQFIFYFSGHGEIRNDNYCLKFGKNYLPFGSLMNEIQSSGVKRAILIIDACHSGAALEGVKNDNHPSQPIDEESIPKGITVIASSQKSQTSRELKDGSFSVFTKLFCQGIQSGLDEKSTSNGYISIADIISYINNKLNNDENYSEFHQRPIYLIGKADGEIWISKNKSGKIPKQIQPQITEAVTSSEELKILYEKTLPNLHPCVNASIQDLDWDLIKSFAKEMQIELDKSLSNQEILSKLQLYSPIQHGGQYYLHKSAVLCFYNRPETIFHQARSIFAAGNSSDSEFISENIYGSLSYQVLKLIEKTKEYLQKISFVDNEGIRREVEEIDVEVIRELISNAIAHRDYSLTGTVKVSITPDRLEVQNPGKFPSRTSWDELISCLIEESCPSDVAVSQYLRMLRVFEGFGRGFSTFRKYIQKNGSESITCIESNTLEPTICIRIPRTKLKQLTTGKTSIDWLIIWGVTKAAGVVVYPILEGLAQDASKDYDKDFFKDCLKNVIRLPEPDVLKEAYGKALKNFLELIQDELQGVGYTEAIIKQYVPFLKKFIDREEVAAALGMAFNVECKAINTALLVRVWSELNSPYLPEDMNWDFLSKSYIRSVKKIVQNSDKLRLIFEVQTFDKIADAVQEVAGVAPAFDLEKYAEGLREQYGNLKLESLDTTGVYYNDLKLWKIFIPQNLRECQEFIPQVYELPKDRARLLQGSGQLDALEIAEAELENHRKRYIEQPIRGVFEVLGDPKESAKDGVAKYAVILGDPGSGKSTLLQYLALIWAERPVRDFPFHPLPLLLELRTYARDKQARKCKDIVSFIHGGDITCRLNQQKLHENLKNGDVIALFDGFDEVFDPALRDEVMTDIYRFINEYPAVRVIVTSRWLGYKAQRLRDAGFQHFMLQELNDEQMQEFVLRWHDLNFVEGADKDRKRERLQNAIRESRSIKELAGNPLMIMMMAILNRNQELLRDRLEFYNQASRVLLDHWDIGRNLMEDRRVDPKTIDYRDKQAMLRKVAYYIQSSAKGLAGNLISVAQLESILTDYLKTIEVEKSREIARIMIGQLRTRNFSLCDLGGGSYGFVHRTFLEYFCAWEFVWQFRETQTLTIKQLIHDVFGKHWQDESWHEVLRLISGMIEPRFVAEIIDFLLEQKVDKGAYLDDENCLKKEGLSNLLLAANCLFEVRNKNIIAAASSRLLKTLQHEVEQESPYKFVRETATIVISTIAITWQDIPETFNWLKDCLTFNLNSYVPESAIQAIAQVWKEEPNLLQFLKNRAVNDSNEYVRNSSLVAIIQGWENDPDIFSILKERCVNDESHLVRWMSVLNIAQRSEEASNLLSFFQDKAINDDDENVRVASLGVIIRGWKEDPDTLPLIKDRAINDGSWYVRISSLREIAFVWKDQIDSFPLIKNCAIRDENEFVRSGALRTIAQGWKNDPKIFDFLCDRAIHDPFKREKDRQTNPRQTALEAILEYYRDNLQTLELLKAISNNDPDEKLKEFAKKELTKLSENSVGA
jgi:hypothetical protein